MQLPNAVRQILAHLEQCGDDRVALSAASRPSPALL